MLTYEQADLDDKISLRAVLKDAYGVYLVTNMIEHMDPARETRHGINVADVCKVCLYPLGGSPAWMDRWMQWHR
jgi:uncharacterized protein YbjT (DUF2867 family)